MGRAPQLVESVRLPACVHWIDDGGRDTFRARGRRVNRRQTAYDSERTAPAPLMARLATGGLCGACLCAAVGKSLLAGTLLGGIGGIVGAFLGYGIRRRLDLHIKDLVVAVCEDLVAVGLALFLVSR